MKIRKGYEKSTRVSLETGPSSLVQQSAQQETDINHLMARYEKTGLVEHLNFRPRRYEDVSQAPAYDEAMRIVVEAQQAFEELPARLRKKFGNDPSTFLAAVHDEERYDELVAEGVLVSKEVQDEPLPSGEDGGGSDPGPDPSRETAQGAAEGS